MKRILLFLPALLVAGAVKAQTTTDALMMKQRESCLALTYDQGSFDHYWEGETLRSNATIATVQRTTLMPMIAIGVHDKINLLVMTPYVRTKSVGDTGGYLEGAKGFQDIGVAVKGELVNKQMGKGKLFVLANAGFSTPMTNYLSDYMPYSLGFGATEINVRGIVQYELDKGMYVRVAAAHLWRGQTEIERDYYYNNGSYYTKWMDVPSVWNYHAVLGSWLLKKSLRVEATFMGLMSTSGDDIRKYNAPQPTNKVEVGQANLFAQYYFKQPKGLGVLAYYSYITNGRNTGQMSNVGIGATYQFKL